MSGISGRLLASTEMTSLDLDKVVRTGLHRFSEYLPRRKQSRTEYSEIEEWTEDRIRVIVSSSCRERICRWVPLGCSLTPYTTRLNFRSVLVCCREGLGGMLGADLGEAELGI